jgi:glycosyltransferase involved in cell wall biosynthesis
LRYVIIGGPAAPSGNYPLRLQRLVDKLRLNDRVLLAGVQSPDEVATWLSASNLFVLPTEREGSPNAIWEALACGLPVVATRVGEIERMIPSYAGMLLEASDDDEKLKECLLAAIRTNWDAERIRAHAARHTWDDVAGRVVEQWSLVTPAAIHTPAVCGQS